MGTAVPPRGARGCDTLVPLATVPAETFITAVPSTHCLKILVAHPHVSVPSYLPLDSTKNVTV